MFRGLFRDSNDSLTSTETHESQLSDTFEPPPEVISRDIEEVINMAQVQEKVEKLNDNSIPNQISGWVQSYWSILFTSLFYNVL